MSNFWKDVVGILREAAIHYGSIRKLAEAANMNPSTISKWLANDPARNQRSPNIREVGQLMDMLGVRVILPSLQEAERDDPASANPLSEKIRLLREEKEMLQVELEKEKAVSARLQEILQSVAKERSP